MNAEHEQRLEIAADWLLRLREAAIRPDEIAEWIAWCDADPLNRQAFVRQQALWHQTGHVRELPPDAAELAADTYSGQVPVRDWLAARRSGPVKSSRRPLFGALAAALAVATIAVALWFVYDYGARSALHEMTIAPVEGTNQEVMLPDGTSVTVVGGSSLKTHYSAGERHIFLKRGKAFFRVERDSRRPFVVHALDTKVTAIGTAFVVHANDGVVEVAVTEGTVDVGRPQPVPSDIPGTHEVAGVANIRVEAGYQITLTEDVPAPEFASINAADIEAEVTGTLRFTDEPLSSVVEIVNRRAQTFVSLTDHRLGELRFTGTVVISRLDEWLRGLPNVFPVRIEGSAATGAAIVPQQD